MVSWLPSECWIEDGSFLCRFIYVYIRLYILITRHLQVVDELRIDYKVRFLNFLYLCFFGWSVWKRIENRFRDTSYCTLFKQSSLSSLTRK
jgi:hypothetical protein